MADIFFSYAKVDRDRVKPLIEALEAEPWNVWWDNDLTVGGSWSEEIKTELYSAPCAVVAWTNSSIKSEFVQDEARRAHKAGKLVPLMLDPVELPMGFGGVQTADFTTWNGDRQSIEFIRLRGAIQKKLTGAASTEPATVPPSASEPKPSAAVSDGHRVGLKTLLSALAVVAIGAGTAIWLLFGGITTSPPGLGYTVFVHSARPQTEIATVVQKLQQAGYKIGGSDAAADNDSGRASPRSGVDYALPDPDTKHQAAARAAAEIANEALRTDIKPRPQSGMSASNLGIWLPYKGDYKVTIRFAGDFDRASDIVPFAQKLRAAGWRVQDTQPSGGNDRTSLAAGQREVRYAAANDQAFAELLAADVQRSGIIAGTVASAQGSDIAGGNLEVWISSTGAAPAPSGPTAWGDRPPDQAYCFQRKDSPAAPGKFLVRCFQTENACATVQRTDSGQKTSCILARGLTGSASWQDAGKGGVGDSWFKYSNSQFVRPFPEF